MQNGRWLTTEKANIISHFQKRQHSTKKNAPNYLSLIHFLLMGSKTLEYRQPKLHLYLHSSNKHVGVDTEWELADYRKRNHGLR